ncbi:hypothetical protein P3S68_011134 [Capsicum galapagoense]
MSRFLAICQDIKILSPILDMIPYSFSIRLAALASCKELIDLEKWLSSNLNTYKDAFYEECIKFLKEVHLAAQDVNSNHFFSPNALWTIYSETSSTFLKVLQSHSGLVSSPDLFVEVDKLHVTYKGTNSRFKCADSSDLSSSDFYSEDIEAEANLRLHQLFTGQLTNDTMMLMPAHLKESTEKREQSIFRCMIVRLFTESFAKYPVRQLQMAAVLFGMFVFGIGALTQFVERLIEWPYYCSRIVKVYRLRTDHPELVEFIEQDVARTSQAHAGHCPAVDAGHEAEARLYFHQMFSGQLTNDAMIEMLAHFKGSTDNRERAIFRCMIVMLFGEFKLVLAQFVDRLIEWSQYCIRIVQISHLRSSHPELVAFVERALSRVSQAHASHSSVADGYANDIEAEATLHFHQMFSGQLTSHAMIQMLAHFKGSTDNREQAIFQCMIAKLCRECKLYAMYPERQLKIAAAFLVIKKINNISIAHVRGEQLKRISYKNCKRVTYKSVINLVCKICNQALRAVLDELHEAAADSKISDAGFLQTVTVKF